MSNTETDAERIHKALDFQKQGNIKIGFGSLNTKEDVCVCECRTREQCG